MKLRPAQACAAAIAIAAAAAAPALAHPGDHHGMGLGELAFHLSTGWHLAVLGIAAAAGVVIATLGARREARARSRKSERQP